MPEGPSMLPIGLNSINCPYMKDEDIRNPPPPVNCGTYTKYRHPYYESNCCVNILCRILRMIAETIFLQKIFLFILL